MKTRVKPDWMNDCKFIDELVTNEIAYVSESDFVVLDDLRWVISCDCLCSPIKRGVHNTMILRDGNVIYVREGEMKQAQGLSNERIEEIFKNSFTALWKPFTYEEKVNILWSERRR